MEKNSRKPLLPSFLLIRENCTLKFDSWEVVQTTEKRFDFGLNDATNQQVALPCQFATAIQFPTAIPQLICMTSRAVPQITYD